MKTTSFINNSLQRIFASKLPAKTPPANNSYSPLAKEVVILFILYILYIFSLELGICSSAGKAEYKSKRKRVVPLETVPS